MKILIGYDGSDVAKKAFKLAVKHTEAEESKIEVVHCLSQDRNLKYEDIKKVEQNLECEAHALVNSETIPYETHVVISGEEYGEALVQFAEENGIDEVVIGIRKKSRTRKLLFGSTAQAEGPTGWWSAG